MSGYKIKFRSNRWIRQKKELLVAICLDDYPAVKRERKIIIDPGTAVLFYHQDGSVTYHVERYCQINENVTHVLMIYSDPFSINIDYSNYQIILKMRINTFVVNDSRGFAQKLRFLLNQRDYLSMDEIHQHVEKVVIQRLIVRGIDKDLSVQKYELQRYFDEYGLHIDQIELFSEQKAVDLYCAGTQDPNIGYLVFLNGLDSNRPTVIPLEDGEYLIARAYNRQTLVQRINAENNSRPMMVWFPKEPGAGTIVRVARIVVANNRTAIFNGWPAHYAREKIVYEDHLSCVKKELSSSQPHYPQDFERIYFQGHPEIELLYVPPTSEYSGMISNDYLTYLENNGLWAVAAICWKNLGNYDRALVNFENALECVRKTGNNQVEEANILFLMGNILMSVSSAVDYVEKIQKHAFELLNLPWLEIFVRGKVGVQEKPRQIGVFVRNKSDHRATNDIQIQYYCDELGVYQKIEVGNLAPLQETKAAFWLPGIFKVGKFPAKMIINFYTNSSDYYELWRNDFLEIIKRRPQIFVGGDLPLIHLEDETPDIHVGGDVGFTKIVHKPGN
jgi:tetratricopeptide (TPR) repeat protein